MSGCVLNGQASYLELQGLIEHEAIAYHFLFFSCSFLNDVYPPYNCLHGKKATCSYSEIRTRKEKINKIYACLFPQNHFSILLKTDARPQVMAYDSELLMKLFFFWQIEKNSFLILGNNYS